MLRFFLPLFCFITTPLFSFSTDFSEIEDDSFPLEEIISGNQNGDNKKYTKIHHAEPLYIDLIRDLGAYKGEKEWNVGFGWNDHKDYQMLEALIEYEFAPIDRLGLEIELPLSIYFDREDNETAPKSRFNSIKLAAQYTFLVAEKINTSLAIGYLHEFEMTDFKSYGKDKFFTGNIYSPFFVAAKSWGKNFHTLVYTGPEIHHHFEDKSFNTTWQINTNLHYMLPNTGHFIGVEFNKEVTNRDFEMTLRPQMRLSLSHNLLLGLVGGISVNNPDQRLSVFTRLIYEPEGKRKKLNK